ncbi:hypothetical protein ARMGADRAFT_1006398 [Armillaria gallica]|uniref:Uncharacterized protein n=1 Tax=Armillaria gallica TaxID=47427 RepID=A0A2H3E8V7_ARMGA|nr:hypothetical protein ARMGADRAFT_1006398 [Armillaria gallica]
MRILAFSFASWTTILAFFVLLRGKRKHAGRHSTFVASSILPTALQERGMTFENLNIES